MKWNDIKEGQPAKSGYYWVFDRDGQTEALWSKDTKEWKSIDRPIRNAMGVQCLRQTLNPTYWMNLPDDPISKEKVDQINSMTRIEMARAWRLGGESWMFDKRLPYHKLFNERFKKLGGFNPSISKQIGW